MLCTEACCDSWLASSWHVHLQCLIQSACQPKHHISLVLLIADKHPQICMAQPHATTLLHQRACG